MTDQLDDALHVIDGAVGRGKLRGTNNFTEES